MKNRACHKFGKTLLLVISLCFLPACQGQTQPSNPTPPQSPGYRLESEKSPYLRQHADNQVEWYPWGEEAFTKAREENKLIFLSIGYSTCHWCHVMEEESFMDKEIGAYLAQHFVSIKVDRETRPDVDAVYMDFVQKATGSGGWPLTTFLTPDRIPIYGGTYYPNPPKYGRPGFLDVLKNVQRAWVSNSQEVSQQATKMAAKLAESSQAQGGSELPGKELLPKALNAWTSRFDESFGGFLPAPKFPSPPDLDFLLRYAVEKKDAKAKKMALKTLEQIALGGIHDHLEGGFHRYSTDKKWLVPHFEKMLYDQAQLMACYAQAYAITKNPLFEQAVSSIDQYLELRMVAPSGGYYSAEDADSTVPDHPSEHAEGAFYVWSIAQLESDLSSEELEMCKNLLGVKVDGNAKDPQGELKGKNVLHLQKPLEGEKIANLLVKLRDLRSSRPRPHRDEKILTEWNAMIARGYAEAGRYLNKPDFLKKAQDTLAFLEKSMLSENRLQRSLLEGKAEIDAFAIDHTQMVAAYLSLFEATGNPHNLERAIYWQDKLQEKFWDTNSSGYFDTQAQKELPYRRKSFFDGATMSANTCSAINLEKLYSLTGKEQYGKTLEELLKLTEAQMKETPTAMPGTLSALLGWYGSHESVILVSSDENWKSVLRDTYKPSRTLILVNSEEDDKKLKTVIPFLPPWSSHNRAYRCRDFACDRPIESLKKLKESL